MGPPCCHIFQVVIPIFQKGSNIFFGGRVWGGGDSLQVKGSEREIVSNEDVRGVRREAGGGGVL